MIRLDFLWRFDGVAFGRLIAIILGGGCSLSCLVIELSVDIQRTINKCIFNV